MLPSWPSPLPAPHRTAQRVRAPRHGDRMNDPLPGPIDQLGYVVADLGRSTAAARAWNGADPVRIIDVSAVSA
ncbi:glyoxalase [Burkholderia pseudomultivorans]|nr:glyoxalase [Burkholderia pseudomultivorans]